MAQQVNSDMIKVDSSKPTTKIQFQMADGKKLVQTFNHDHTMSDLFLFAGAQNDFGFQFEVCEPFLCQIIKTASFLASGRFSTINTDWRW